MTDVDTVRALTGLSSDIVPDSDLSVHIELAQDWCSTRAQGFGLGSAPDAAVALMSLFFLRNYLDLKGIKPSSISYPDLSMSTDVRSMCELAKTMAVEQIKSAAYKNGSAFRQIRSGKVRRWH